MAKLTQRTVTLSLVGSYEKGNFAVVAYGLNMGVDFFSHVEILNMPASSHNGDIKSINWQYEGWVTERPEY